MNEYLSLVNFILSEGMLEWFNLKDVRTTSANGQTTSISIWMRTRKRQMAGQTFVPMALPVKEPSTIFRFVAKRLFCMYAVVVG